MLIGGSIFLFSSSGLNLVAQKMKSFEQGTATYFVLLRYYSLPTLKGTLHYTAAPLVK